MITQRKCLVFPFGSNCRSPSSSVHLHPASHNRRDTGASGRLQEARIQNDIPMNIKVTACQSRTAWPSLSAGGVVKRTQQVRNGPRPIEASGHSICLCGRDSHHLSMSSLLSSYFLSTLHSVWKFRRYRREL